MLRCGARATTERVASGAAVHKEIRLVAAWTSVPAAVLCALCVSAVEQFNLTRPRNPISAHRRTPPELTPDPFRRSDRCRSNAFFRLPPWPPSPHWPSSSAPAPPLRCRLQPVPQRSTTRPSSPSSTPPTRPTSRPASSAPRRARRRRSATSARCSRATTRTSVSRGAIWRRSLA